MDESVGPGGCVGVIERAGGGVNAGVGGCVGGVSDGASRVGPGTAVCGTEALKSTRRSPYVMSLAGIRVVFVSESLMVANTTQSSSERAGQLGRGVAISPEASHVCHSASIALA